MKKIILVSLFILLLTTGCTCEYTLKIEDNKYKETIKIIAGSENEKTNLNFDWKIPTDKEEYNIAGDSSTNIKYKSDLYNYELNNNILKFNYDFNKSNYINSSAVSECYDNLNLIEKNGKIIISTNLKAKCFDSQPDLTELAINIITDKKVISNNADLNNGEIYTWYIDRSNYKNKSINITLTANNQDKPVTSSINSQSQSNNNNSTQAGNDYTLYIALGIILLIMIIGYLWFMKIQEKNNQMND